MTTSTAPKTRPTVSLSTIKRGSYGVAFGVENPPETYEYEVDGVTLVRTRINLRGNPHVNAYRDAVVAQLARNSADVESFLRAAASNEANVTMFRTGTTEFGYRTTQIQEVQLRPSHIEGNIGYRSKGAQTYYRLSVEEVFAASAGWGEKPRNEVVAAVQHASDQVPVVRELTREDLAACYDPREAAEPGDPDFDPNYDAYDLANTKTVVYFTHPGFDFGNGPVPGCEFHITYSIPNEEDPSHSIYGGQFFAPEDSYLVSEAGSFYEEDLLKFDAGLVIAPAPAAEVDREAEVEVQPRFTQPAMDFAPEL